MDFSLSFFGCPPVGGGASHDYRLLLDAARFADERGLASVWTPERHFHRFGGLFPNPALAAAAMAACTRRVGLRAGSVVLPLHDPLTVAEDWALVDALSGGRTGISFASGWQDQDFLLRPETYARRREVLWERIGEFRHLWRGGSTRRTGPSGMPAEVRIQPRPVQPEAPIWITAAGTGETFERAGRGGFHVLTHLLGMDLEGLRERVRVYRRARADAGFDPDGGRVTLMIHTHLRGAGSGGASSAEVRVALKGFLADSLELIQTAATPWAFGAYRARADAGADGVDTGLETDRLDAGNREAILEHSADRFLGGLGLFGSLDEVGGVVEAVRDAGVDEVACLVDFGLSERAVLEGLPGIVGLQEWFRARPGAGAGRARGAGVEPAPVRAPMAVDETCPWYREVKSIWCGVLGVSDSAPDADFFDLGGHSLHAVRFVEEVRARCAYEIPLATLFKESTLGAVASRVSRGRRERAG